jgi:hypothetical protein
MGSGYNDSVAASNSARGKASTRTPVHFYLDVPMYEYDLGCGRNAHIHSFQSRTPLVPIDDDENTITVWCSGCQEFREIDASTEPLNRPTSTDEVTAFEQDKGILRERIALNLQDIGFIDTEAEVIELAVKFGVPVGEIKKLNAGLRAPEGLSGLPDMCAKGLHEMTPDNISLNGAGRRNCKACKLDAQRARRTEKSMKRHTPPIIRK